MNNGIQPTVELATNNGNGFAYPYPVMGGFGGNGFGGFGQDGAIWIILIIALLGGFNNGNGGWEGNYPTFYSATYTSGSFSFNVEKDKIYYICIDNGENSGEHSNAFHLHWFKFTPTFRLDALAKVVDLDKDVENGSIKLTKIYGYGKKKFGFYRADRPCGAGTCRHRSHLWHPEDESESRGGAGGA